MSLVDTAAAIIRTQACTKINFDHELFNHLISIYSKITIGQNNNNVIPKMRVYSETLRLLNLELSFGKSILTAMNFSLQPILNVVINSKDIRGITITIIQNIIILIIIIRLH